MTGDKTARTGRAWIELNREALLENVRTIRAMLPPGCRLMPAVKANAYGHGSVLIAKELQKAGVQAFCVACVAEGVRLRRCGIQGEILVLGYTDEKELATLHRWRLSQTVLDFSYAQKLNRWGKKLHVHVGVDTGMHRLGIRSENREEIMSVLEMENLQADGLFTHLCVADSDGAADRAFTKRQAGDFYRLADEVKSRRGSCPRLHLLSSYGIFRYREYAQDYVRPGIALYGVLSREEDQKGGPPLFPVLSLKARVACVKRLHAGETAGYGRAFLAGGEKTIATLAIGYADGVPYSLADGGASVLLEGKKAPIVGRICMDQMLVDVSGIEGVKAGDTAVLIGTSGMQEITAMEVAGQCNTISNEILSRLGERLERIVV